MPWLGKFVTKYLFNNWNLSAPGAGSWTFRENHQGETVLTSRFTLRAERLPWWLPAGLYKASVERDTKVSFERLRRLVVQGLQERSQQSGDAS